MKEFRSLKGINEVNGFSIRRLTDEIIFNKNDISVNGVAGDIEKFITNHSIFIVDSEKTITFKFQDGSVAENGTNGVQVDIFLEFAKIMLTYLNKEVQCNENLGAIYSINQALDCLENRKKRLRGKAILDHYEKNIAIFGDRNEHD